MVSEQQKDTEIIMDLTLEQGRPASTEGRFEKEILTYDLLD